MSFLLDYLDLTEAGVTRLELETQPVDSDKDLDYAVLQLKSELPQGITPVRLAARSVQPRQRLRVIHHPAGQPKVMTQFRCIASMLHQAGGQMLRHTCDTLPGSSGALILDHDENVAIGLHHSGGLSAHDSQSFNTATSVQALAQKSELIRQLIPANNEPRSRPVAAPANPPPANRIERGNAAPKDAAPATTPQERLNNIIAQ